MLKYELLRFIREVRVFIFKDLFEFNFCNDICCLCYMFIIVVSNYGKFFVNFLCSDRVYKSKLFMVIRYLVVICVDIIVFFDIYN